MKKCSGTKPVFQGDLMIIPIKEIPASAIEMKTTGKYHIVAHSETGHHHVLDAQKTRVYRASATAMLMYAEVLKQTGLLHQRPYDTHEELSFTPGNYQLLRQREGAPSGFRVVAD